VAKFDPLKNALHLVGKDSSSYNQYRPKLYGRAGGDWKPECGGCNIQEERVRFRRAEGTDKGSVPPISPISMLDLQCPSIGPSIGDGYIGGGCMGIPMFVLKQCPVVALHTSACYNKELYQLIMLLMPSELGAAQIRTLCRKMRSTLYAADARTYREYHALVAHRRPAAAEDSRQWTVR
jgi:hypothetical protein